MNGSDRVRYQFQINVFNRYVTVCMSKDFADVIFDLINEDKTCAERMGDLLAAFDCIERDSASFDSDSQEKFVYLQYQGMYQLICTSAFAKELADSLGMILSNMRCEKEHNDYPIDVIFAFVKKLEMAAFNHYRELQGKPQNRFRQVEPRMPDRRFQNNYEDRPRRFGY